MNKKIEISYKTIILSILTIAGIWILYLIRQILMNLSVALLITAILNPLVTKLSKKKVPRPLSVLLSYLLVIALFVLTALLISPSLIDQTTSFVTDLPEFVDSLKISSLVSDQIIQQLLSQLASLPAQVAKIVISILSNMAGVLAVLILTFYLLAERESLDDHLKTYLGKGKGEEFIDLINVLEQKLGGWARGELITMVLIGFFDYIGFKLLGLPFALPLAIFAGLMEIVPSVGSTIAAIPSVIIGFGVSLFMGLATISWIFLIQQIEGYVLIPKITQKSTGVNPITTILCLAVGLKLGGGVGLLISVPVYITLKTIAQKYLFTK